MPLVEEGPGIEARANVLASQSLAAQLTVLQAFLPLPGWVVGRNCDMSCAPVVANGIFQALPLKDLVLFFSGEWGGDPLANGYSYRRVTCIEQQILGLEPAGSDSPVYLIKADLDVHEVVSGGCVLGLTNELPSSLAWRADEVRSCLTALALTLALHSELNVAESLMLELRRDAFLDPLTGTLNRAGWINRLAHIDAMSGDDNNDAAIVMLDLDFLKVVNDTYGHSAGDDLIRLTAQTITSVLRTNDAVGRLGGDEFGVVAQYATPVVAAALVSRLKHALDAVGVRISMGMALKSEAGTLKKTMHLADERMYEDKRTKPMPRRLPLSVRIGMAVG
ncbi:GGDEF domain-containing protein [Candidimonas sp. SYP-B2681]|uniref:GGDEF domain-containing protein n=1 Tax=Candidimonas sp. SYP-B2681 TaxID=2497686 RepID=UPI000F89769C|nr:GGDEF domain-containing protein [Candidimonas sp. SYP-B2681]RTZ45376.1 GGDEF domain-containing protein [Candidimonas sp. SYP-B2681]